MPAAVGGRELTGSPRINPLAARVCATAFAVLFITAFSVSAQEPGRSPISDFSRLQERLKTGDDIVVETEDGTTIRGRVVEVSTAQMTVVANNVRRHMPSGQVRRSFEAECTASTARFSFVFDVRFR